MMSQKLAIEPSTHSTWKCYLQCRMPQCWTWWRYWPLHVQCTLLRVSWTFKLSVHCTWKCYLQCRRRKCRRLWSRWSLHVQYTPERKLAIEPSTHSTWKCYLQCRRPEMIELLVITRSIHAWEQVGYWTFNALHMNCYLQYRRPQWRRWWNYWSIHVQYTPESKLSIEPSTHSTWTVTCNAGGHNDGDDGAVDQELSVQLTHLLP